MGGEVALQRPVGRPSMKLISASPVMDFLISAFDYS
jgi:hypothetical protein